MNSSSEVLKTVSQLRFGDLIEVEWWDHSKREIRLKPEGRKRYLVFDVPVKSVGIFFGVAGEEAKHIVLIRDIFIWPSMGDFDVDATAILLGVTKNIRVIARGLLDPKLATQLRGAWERGQVRIVKRGKHMRLRIGKIREVSQR
ncbi:MAG: hypothetical protein ACE5OW_03600 [Candidatus Bathyarchaeia archaeon]